MHYFHHTKHAITMVSPSSGLFTSKDVRSLIDEILKMQEFHHLHVMSLVGVCLDSGAGPAIVMPYMANGSLLDYLRKDRDSILLTADASPNKVIIIGTPVQFLKRMRNSTAKNKDTTGILCG